MGQSVDDKTSEEALTGLNERLKVITPEEIGAHVDALFDDPNSEFAKRVEDAREKINVFQPKKTIVDRMSEKIESLKKGVVRIISGEDTEVSEKDVTQATKDFGQWYEDNLRSEMKKVFSDLLYPMPGHFNESAHGKADEPQEEYSKTDIKLAESLVKLYYEQGREVFEPVISSFINGDEDNKKIAELVNKLLVEDGELPFKAQSSDPVKPVVPTY